MRADLLTEGISFDMAQDEDEVKALLVMAASEFLRAGGVLLLGDWARLSEESRAAFVEASGGIHEDVMAQALHRAVSP